MTADLDLDGYLPYLLNRAGARIATAFTGVARDYGITLPMWRVLAVLNHHGALRVGALARLTTIDVSTLSRVLDGMERKGLVARRRGGGDQRSVTVETRPAGRDLTAKVIPVAHHYEDVALAGFDAAEARALKAMLIRLFENLDRLDDERRAEQRDAG